MGPPGKKKAVRIVINVIGVLGLCTLAVDVNTIGMTHHVCSPCTV